MASKRYVVTLEDVASGRTRRFNYRCGFPLIADNSDFLVAFTLSLRRLAVVLSVLLGFPIVYAVAARWSVHAELQALRTTAETLEVENASYRAASLELTGQIASLQSAVNDLSERADLDPTTVKALSRLPAIMKSHARGGAVNAPPVREALSAALPLPEDTFGVLSEVLGLLQDRLQLVETDVARRARVAAATPTIWPAHGWLSGTFGRRPDPFTGQLDFHGGLDISADRGSPVYATADGIVESAVRHAGYGNLLTIDHGLGIKTRYGHLQDFGVPVGARVTRGQVVARIGSTGRSTAPHLHYEILVNGQAINPFQLLLEPRPKK